MRRLYALLDRHMDSKPVIWHMVIAALIVWPLDRSWWTFPVVTLALTGLEVLVFVLLRKRYGER